MDRPATTCHISLLERCRIDRRNLLVLLLSSSSSAAAVNLAAVDLDTVSVDYALQCIASSVEFDPSEATRRYFEELKYPIMHMGSSSGISCFFVSRAEMAGSPPRRAAPTIASHSVGASFKSLQSSTRKPEHVVYRDVSIMDFDKSDAVVDRSSTEVDEPFSRESEPTTLSLDLPRLSTGLSDDDIRETAYEVLLASLMSGGQTCLFEEKKKEKKSILLKSLRHRKEYLSSRSETESCNSDTLDLIRAQMEISESFNALTKQGLKSFLSKQFPVPIIVPLISLELLSAVDMSNFPSKRLRVQWQLRQANVLEELLLYSASTDSGLREAMGALLSKMRSTEEWILNPSDDAIKTLNFVKNFASELSSFPRESAHLSQPSYWISTYPFNVRLYEKLLCSVFDVLEEGHILEKSDDIIGVIQDTWSILGITAELHDALYVWVLFQKFLQTGEVLLLNHIEIRMQKVLSTYHVEEADVYMSTLICFTDFFGDNRPVNLIDAIGFKVYRWCNYQLEDYHRHFVKDKCVTIEPVVSLAVILESTIGDKFKESKLQFREPIIEFNARAEHKALRSYIAKSLQAAFRRALSVLEDETTVERQHPLVRLASLTKLVLEEEFRKFSPVLSRHYPESGVFACVLLHLLYGKQLKLFLDDFQYGEKHAKEVFSAAYGFELSLACKVYSAHEDNIEFTITNHLQPYQLQHFCSPLTLQWLHDQHGKLLEWATRATQIETWEPLSIRQRYASSAVEIFRIVEETISQFFGLNLPLETIHLRSLLIGIVSILDAYLMHLISEQVPKSLLYPEAPVLTRHTDSSKAFTKKKIVEPTMVMEDNIRIKLNNLTVPKLCVKLNTIHYIRQQLDSVEESIKNLWSSVQSDSKMLDFLSRATNKKNFSFNGSFSTPLEPVEELFTIFDDVRRSAIDAGYRILDLIGPRAIFFDLREHFLSSLYQGNVENARLGLFISTLDEVLDKICDLIIGEFRDQVVLGVCQVSMEGFIWVLLNGGPSRAFSDTDLELMQEDLRILKDLFVAEDQGLSRDAVEKEAAVVQHILDLYSLKVDALTNMLVTEGHDEDPQTLLRVLCHKKDKSASQFLKVHYQLPKSSDYEDIHATGTVPKQQFLPSMFKRSTSFDWAKAGQRSFKMMKQKIQKATSK